LYPFDCPNACWYIHQRVRGDIWISLDDYYRCNFHIFARYYRFASILETKTLEKYSIISCYCSFGDFYLYTVVYINLLVNFKKKYILSHVFGGAFEFLFYSEIKKN